MPAVPKYEDWKAPWEAKDEDFDEEVARKFIHGLLSDKEKLQAKVTTANTERDEAKTALTEKQKELDTAVASGPDKDTVEKLQASVKEAEVKAAKAEAKVLRYDVAVDKNVPLKQAKRLQGNTKEELEADADEFLKDFSPADAEDEDDEDNDDETSLSRVPRLTNSTDPKRGEDVTLDIDKAVASIPRY